MPHCMGEQAMGVLRVAAVVGMTALAGLVDACGGRAGGNAKQSGGSGVAGAASGGEDQEQAGATPGFGEAGGRQDATGGSIDAGGGTLFIGGAGKGGADGNVATGGGAGYDASASENGGGVGGAVETLHATGGALQGSGGQSCVPSLMDAHLRQTNLLFLYDRSGSMGDATSGAWGNLELRWNPAKEAMRAFMEGTTSPATYVSLKFFPDSDAGSYDEVCAVENYEAPDVPLTSLQTPDDLIDALESESTSGGTPTLSALMGTAAYAKVVAQQDPRAMTTIVLITDGEPVVVDGSGPRTDDCPAGSDNTIENVAAVAAAAYQGSPRISTYVIGIGVGTSNLDAVAQAGGTALIYIDDVSPEDVRSKLLQALASIQSEHLSCNVPVPDLGPGLPLDYATLGLNFVHGTGSTESLPHDDSCAGPGWHYDSPSTPNHFVLCPETCDVAQADAKGAFEVVFGCSSW